jgi:hypothetical protein
MYILPTKFGKLLQYFANMNMHMQIQALPIISGKAVVLTPGATTFALLVIVACFLSKQRPNELAIICNFWKEKGRVRTARVALGVLGISECV